MGYSFRMYGRITMKPIKNSLVIIPEFAENWNVNVLFFLQSN